MKIFLTHGYFIMEDLKEQRIMKPYVPLGILYISAYLDRHGFENQVFDSTFSRYDDLCNELLSQKPDIIGIYTNLMTKLNVLRIILFVRRTIELKHAKIVLGGPEVRNHIPRFLESGADIIVVGEGEQTMLELVQSIDEKQPDLSKINGIAYRNRNNEICINPEGPKLKDREELHFPTRKK